MLHILSTMGKHNRVGKDTLSKRSKSFHDTYCTTVSFKQYKEQCLDLSNKTLSRRFSISTFIIHFCDNVAFLVLFEWHAKRGRNAQHKSISRVPVKRLADVAPQRRSGGVVFSIRYLLSSTWMIRLEWLGSSEIMDLNTLYHWCFSLSHKRAICVYSPKISSPARKWTPFFPIHSRINESWNKIKYDNNDINIFNLLRGLFNDI